MQKISIENSEPVPGGYNCAVYHFATDTETQEFISDDDLLNELEAVSVDRIPVPLNVLVSRFDTNYSRYDCGYEEDTRYVTLQEWQAMKGHSLGSVFEKIISRRK